MDYTTLGRTGIKVSVVGLGAGGPSRIGKSLGKDSKESIAVVRRATELGITFFDTAESYATEEYFAEGLADMPADSVCISTKVSCKVDDRIKTPGEFEQSLDQSLKRLKRERIDIYHLHAVMPDEYDETRDCLYPVLQRAIEKGKVGFTGITEMFGKDSGHTMLDRALQDDLWDVIMIGFSAINFSARPLLKRTQKQGVGVLDMFAVRRALRDLATIQERMAGHVAEGVLSGDAVEKERPFAHVIETGICETVPETSYRFCRHESGIDVVLSGTSSIDHLEENVAAMAKPCLPSDVNRRIEAVFGGVNSLSGN